MPGEEDMSRERLLRAAGTRTAWDVAQAFFIPLRRARTLSDIEAVERGEGRTVGCFFRGLFGPYPDRFTNLGSLDLAHRRAVWRPLWIYAWRQDWPITDPVASAFVRPRDPETDRPFKGAGSFAPGGAFEWRGFSVVVCQTPHGHLEFAVPNPDIDLVVAYFARVYRGRPHEEHPVGE
jgi:hypothetical protein